MLRLDINLVLQSSTYWCFASLMKKFLFKPVNNIIAQREEAIKSSLMMQMRLRRRLMT